MVYNSRLFRKQWQWRDGVFGESACMVMSVIETKSQ